MPGIVPVNLMVEYARNPLGLDETRPRFSWTLESDENGQSQSAFRIVVANDPNDLLDSDNLLWDTGKVESSAMNQIEYQGTGLQSFQKVWWAVKVWDKKGLESDLSEPACFEMGILNMREWEAQWIASPHGANPAPLFRKEFLLDAKFKQARVYICGLGCYEFYLNGCKIGDHVLDPAQTDYEQRAFYVTYDITSEVRSGDNCVGVMLGDGWFNQDKVWGGVMTYGEPRLLGMLRIEMEDGSILTVGTGPDWKCAPGPILMNNIYLGETYDARREISGWSNAGLDESGWVAAKIVDCPTQRLEAQSLQPIKMMKTLQAVEILRPESRVYIYDLGQNFAGWPRLKVEAPEGTAVTMRMAEILDDQGNLNTSTTGVIHTGGVQTETYICKGDGVEVYEPRFTYHGFRYVEVTRYAGAPTLDDIEGVVVHTSVEPAGHFECSDWMLNQIHETALWTQVSNMHGLPTDCPHREKCGWLGDSHIAAEMSIFNYDMPRFWTKYVQDIETTSRGGIPNMIAPGKRDCGKASPDWGTAFCQIPWYLYVYYGDRRILSRHWDGMKRWMTHFESLADGYIVSEGLGDWCPPQPVAERCAVPITSTAFFYFDAKIMARVAAIVDKPDEAEYYRRLAEKIKTAFISRFYKPNEKTYGWQTADAFALYLGLVPDGEAEDIARSLNADVMEKHGGHHFTGITGWRFLLGQLGRFGYSDTAMEILHKEDYPSIGQWFKWGGTTFWEHWDHPGPLGEKAGSLNHPMQGGFDEWFYSGLGGINPDPSHPGFEHFILRPQIPSVLEWVNVDYNGIRGRISSYWKKSDGKLIWNVTIPVNSTATIYFPAQSIEEVTESGRPVGSHPDLKLAAGGTLAVDACSGSYEFVIG